MKIELEMPSEWADVTLREFIELNSLDFSGYENPINYYVDVLKIFGNDVYDIIDYFKMSDIEIIAGHLKFMQTPPVKTNIKEVKIDGKVFKLIKNMNEITVGEYVSIETLIDTEKLDSVTAMDVILSVILRPEGEVFDATKIAARRSLFKEKLNIEDVLGMSVFFSTGEA